MVLDGSLGNPERVRNLLHARQKSFRSVWIIDSGLVRRMKQPFYVQR